MAMSGNGPRTAGTTTTMARQWTAPLGSRATAPSACSAAVPGPTLRCTCVPLIAGPIRANPATTSWASDSRATPAERSVRRSRSVRRAFKNAANAAAMAECLNFALILFSGVWGLVPSAARMDKAKKQGAVSACPHRLLIEGCASWKKKRMPPRRCATAGN